MLRSALEKDLSGLSEEARLCVQKLANAGADVFAERALLLDRERVLLEQNNEKKARQSVRSTVIGKAKVMSYEDIVEARKRREKKEADKVLRGSRRIKKSKATRLETVQEEIDQD